MIVPDPSQSWFKIQQRRREPALFLLAVLPVIDFRGPAFHASVDRLEGVRRLQARAEFREDAQAMERQGLFEAFVQTRRRRGVEEREFAAQLAQCRFSEGWDPRFSKPFPPELFPRLTAFSVPYSPAVVQR